MDKELPISAALSVGTWAVKRQFLLLCKPTIKVKVSALKLYLGIFFWGN